MILLAPHLLRDEDLALLHLLSLEHEVHLVPEQVRVRGGAGADVFEDLGEESSAVLRVRPRQLQPPDLHLQWMALCMRAYEKYTPCAK